MQGRKEICPKMMYQVHIGDLVPKDNFYRILDRELNLSYLYKATRHYYGEEVFRSLLKKILQLCVAKGMVSGRRQAMDSAFIKANASMESLHSPTDPEARISTKPGKPRNLNYYGQISVDTSHHVITGAGADYADKRDSQCLEKLCEQTIENLPSLKQTDLSSDFSCFVRKITVLEGW